ncbi:MAG: TonB family protein [Chitinophagaceae bacterium]
MAIILFISKLIVSNGLLYGYYHLFLRNQRFHHYNRFYLLAIAMLSFIIPFVHIPVNLFAGGQQQSTLIQTLKVINAHGWEEPVTIYARQGQWSKLLSIQGGLYLIYTLGLLTGLFFLARSFAWINGLKRKYPYERVDQLRIYNTTEPGTPFSFFKSIFWDKKIPLNDKQGQQIFRHEMFHVKEKHSADILLMEIICCIGWINPFFHLIKKEIKAIHEFLADEYAVSINDRYDYAELLVLHAMNQKAPSISHPFFHHQIKRRINMITTSNLVRRSGYLSRIMALPLLFLLVSAFAVKLTGKPSLATNKNFTNKSVTVVIDPGHGGIYSGANGVNNLLEKDITLSIAKKIKELSAGYNVNIVLTRTRDELVAGATDINEDLQNRMVIANDAKADLFISIHVNSSVEKITNRTGFDTYISGKNENIHDRLLATTILTTLKDIYEVNETIGQRQTGVKVLDTKNCPGILLECGYLTNSKDAAFISNPANQEKVAQKILEGIVQYTKVQPAAISASFIEQSASDTLAAEAVNKLNVTDLTSIDADLHTNIETIHFKNSNVKYTPANEMNKYDALHTIADTVPAVHQERVTFTKVEIEPEYPGGREGWTKYLLKSVQYPEAAVKKNLQGTVVVQFIVDTSGKISDVKAISGPEELKAESIRTVKKSGIWLPARQNGLKVRAYKRQPIVFKLA